MNSNLQNKKRFCGEPPLVMNNVFIFRANIFSARDIPPLPSCPSYILFIKFHAPHGVEGVHAKWLYFKFCFNIVFTTIFHPLVDRQSVVDNLGHGAVVPEETVGDA